MSEDTESASSGENSPPTKRVRTADEMVEIVQQVKREITKERVSRRKAIVDSRMAEWRDDLTENEKIMGLLFMTLHYDEEAQTLGDMLCRIVEAYPPTDDEEKLEEICKDVKEALFTAVNNFLCLKQPSE